MPEFKEGDRVKVKKSGRIGQLIDLNPRPLEEIDLEDECWGYVLSEQFGYEELDGPDDIELVTPADQISIPTMKEFACYVSSALHGGWDEDVTIQESSVSGSVIEVYGTSGTGKRFIAQIEVTVLEEEY